MPIYVYECADHGIQEHNVSMDERDSVNCYNCDLPIQRRIVFRGAVYAPTAKGGLAV